MRKSWRPGQEGGLSIGQFQIAVDKALVTALFFLLLILMALYSVFRGFGLMSRRQIDVMVSFPVFDVISNFNVNKNVVKVFLILWQSLLGEISTIKIVNLQSFVW